MFSLFGNKRIKELERQVSDLSMKVRWQDEEIEALTGCLRKRRVEICDHEKSLKEILLAAKAAVKKAGLPPVEIRRAEADS